MSTDLSSTVRNGGENIWDSALTAASSMSSSAGTAVDAREKWHKRASNGAAARIAQDGQSICRRAPVPAWWRPSEASIENMRRLSRRSFLAASAALAAGPALGATRKSPAPAPEVGRSGSVDVVIVGAGAAGIAAARRLAAAGKRFALIEAAGEVGGRCITDTRTFGVPFDRGAHWIYAADLNPVAKVA